MWSCYYTTEREAKDLIKIKGRMVQPEKYQCIRAGVPDEKGVLFCGEVIHELPKSLPQNADYPGALKHMTLR